jgi:NAD(P)-dependent dehydrogenase (short-subunit alcohol dehydrogenase family)
MSIQKLFSVQDKVIIITGGMGQLGRQFCQALLENGAKVAIFDKQNDTDWLTSRFGKQSNVQKNFMAIEGDVTQRSSIEAALQQIVEHWDPPFGLINNAVLDSPPGSPAEENCHFETYPESFWDQVMDVNVKGVFLSCQVFGGAIAKAGRGSIINIGSIYGVVSPNQNIYEYRRKNGQTFYKPVAYSASKSALINFTRYLATYWAHQNVRVNMLSFGGVFNHQDEDFLREYCSRVPLGRMAREDEYNGASIFLLSDASQYMTGTNLVIDGGWTAW